MADCSATMVRPSILVIAIVSLLHERLGKKLFSARLTKKWSFLLMVQKPPQNFHPWGKDQR